MRFALLTLLAGCQLVFPYESEFEDCVASNDEDGDGVSDCDDACPIVSRLVNPAGDQDRDGDGLGEGCDPTSGSDRIAFFDGFASNRAYSRFDGVLEEDGRALFGDRSGFLLDLPLERLRIRVGFEVVRQTDTPGGFGIAFGATVAPAGTPRGFDGHYCQPYKSHDDTDVFELEHWQGGEVVAVMTDFADWVEDDQMLDGFTGTLELDIADRLRCAIDHPTSAQVINGDRLVDPAGIGLWTFGTEIRIDYVMVVERGD